jgi:tetratricopeptide (TPR) repeat protein
MFARFVCVLALATIGIALSVTANANPINPNSYYAPYMYHFDYWSRCKNRRIEPERRIGYCKAMIGGGHGDDADALTQIGIAYMEQRNYDSAVEAFRAAMTFFSTDITNARDELDEALALSGHYDQAMSDIDVEIASKPRFARVHNQRCWVLAVVGKDLEKALADCNDALKIAADFPDAFDSRGLVNFKLGNLKDSAAD